jgi:beta-1,4-mannosyltransferase
MPSANTLVQVVEELNFANPYARFLVRGYRDIGLTSHLSIGRVSRRSGQAVHLHWPETMLVWKRLGNKKYIKSPTRAVSDIKKRQCDAPFIYTVHNIEPHNNLMSPDIRDACEELVTSPDIFVHHGPSSISMFVGRHPSTSGRLHIVAPHGAYPTVHSSLQNELRAQFRRRIGLRPNQRLILNFGRQRPNRGAPFVSEVARTLERPEMVFLTIGRFAPPMSDSSFQRLGWGLRSAIEKSVAESRVAAIDGRPSVRLSTNLFAASDIVLLPHTSGINSGVLSLAISHGCKVVYPDIGNLSHQAYGWVHAFPYVSGDATSAARAVLAACEDDHSNASKSLVEWRAENSWRRHASIVRTGIASL